MEGYRLWLGLFAFSAGLVFFFNLGNMFATSPGLAAQMIIEIVVTVLILGGLLLMLLNWDWKTQVIDNVMPPKAPVMPSKAHAKPAKWA